ncbi:MAG: class C sortase [Clostridiales bacterium]|nr:class C sortase [Clostridiales bacterium]
MKKRWTNLLLILALLVGVGLLVYPTFADYWNSFHQSRAIASYTQTVATIDNERYDEMWQDAFAYNEQLRTRPNRFYLNEEELALYNSLLDATGLGIMGYIEIPCIGVSLPVYHTTSEAVLQVAVGHIEGSSLPVGGESTHSALSGHRGLPSATLFSNLDKVAIGDTFALKILDQTLTYQVDRILIVEPYDLSGLEIIEGQDLCTLITCTPYGINSHRLLVTGRRIETPEEEKVIRVVADAVQIEPLLVAPVVAAPVLLLLLIVLLITTGGRKKKRNERTGEQ